MVITPPRHPAEALLPSQHPWMPDWMQAFTGWQPPVRPGLVPVQQNMQAPEQAWLEQMRREQMMKEMQR